MPKKVPPLPSATASLAAPEELVYGLVPDILGKDTSVLFCGINPGLTSGLTGHHFARPGNRFWKALALGGLVDRVLEPAEERELLGYGIGITNLVARVTATAKEVSNAELAEGVELLREKVSQVGPAVLAVLGLGAWRSAADKRAQLGRQPEPFGGATVFVLPNPSGLQARYQLPELGAFFAEVRVARDASRAKADGVLPTSETPSG
ncbi:MAG TPA: G/U mismatch-specific DNA glycosylase [Acidimicrobiales bacterium]